MRLKQSSAPDGKEITFVSGDHGPFPAPPSQFGCLTLYGEGPGDEVTLDIGDHEARAAGILRMLHWVQYIYYRSLGDGCLPFHSALVERQGIGCLIAGPKGMGKSTCSRRIMPPWQACSDDEALVVPVGNEYHVHPIPTWSELFNGADRSWDVEWHVPLAGIFFIEQSDADGIEPLKRGEAALSIHRSSMEVLIRTATVRVIEDKGFRDLVLKNSIDIARSVPAYRLNVSLTGRFWDVMDKALADKRAI